MRPLSAILSGLLCFGLYSNVLVVVGSAIIQVGAFENGHYAILERRADSLKVDMYQLRRDQM